MPARLWLIGCFRYSKGVLAAFLCLSGANLPASFMPNKKNRQVKGEKQWRDLFRAREILTDCVVGPVLSQQVLPSPALTTDSSLKTQLAESRLHTCTPCDLEVEEGEICPVQLQ